MSVIRSFDIYVDQGFSALALSCVVGALQCANRVLGEDAYTWRVMSCRTGIVLTDSGIGVSATEFDAESATTAFDCHRRFIVLLASPVSHPAREQLIRSIRASLARGAKLLTVADATKWVVREGLLQGRRCAVHWEDFGTVLENHPSTNVSRSYFEIDGPFHSCAGELATFDVMQRIIGRDHGYEIVAEMSAFAMNSPPRVSNERQVIPNLARLERIGSSLVEMIDLMTDHIADPLPLDVLARRIKVSRRQIERLFKIQLGQSPSRYYMRLRLERAHDLLNHSSLPIVDVAVAVGFTSASHFSKTYRAYFGVAPNNTRASRVSSASDPRRIPFRARSLPVANEQRLCVEAV